jgi:cytoskeletal protein CcmA (bactofilin family)
MSEKPTPSFSGPAGVSFPFDQQLKQESRMFGDKKKVASGAIETLIGKDTVVEGNVLFKGGLRVDGTIRGNVTAEDGASAILVISENALVEGEVHASHLVVNGTINGPVQSDGLVELQPKARITGNLRYRALEMHHGATVDGNLSHLEESRPGLKLAANNE